MTDRPPPGPALVAGNWNGNLGPDDFNGLPNDDARHLAPRGHSGPR